MLRRYPETLRWRQFVPPVFVGSVFILFLLSFWTLARILLALEVSVYFLALFAAGIQQALKRGQPALAISFPIAVATIHFSWGAGLIYSGLASLVRSNG
jgi:hypothetical protein